MDVSKFFRQFIPVIPRDDLNEAMFNLTYSMGGGITYQDILKMRKGRFSFFLERLLEQKKRENEAIEKARKGKPATTKTGKFKYLG